VVTDKQVHNRQGVDASTSTETTSESSEVIGTVGAQGQKQENEVAKKGAPEGKRNSKMPRKATQGRKKLSREGTPHSGITRIDDVVPGKDFHTGKKSTSGLKVAQELSGVVRHHSGENPDVDHEITWVGEDESTSGAATVTKQQQQHQPPLPSSTFNPATITAEDIFEGRVVNNPLFTPQPQQLNDYPSGEVKKVKPLQDAQQHEIKDTKSSQPQLPLVRVKRILPQSSLQQHIPAAFGGRVVTNPIFSPQDITPAAPVSNVVPSTQPANCYPRKQAKEAILNRIEAKLRETSSDDEELEDRTSCYSQCIDTSCQAYACFMPNCKTTIKQEPLLQTEALRKGRTEGSKDFWTAVLPLFTCTWRWILIVIDLALVFLGLFLSITSLSLDENRVFNIAHLVLAIVSAVLAIIDAGYAVISCKSCTCDTNSCCCSCWTNFFDFSRLILSEVIFYPLLICDIFEVIVGRGFEQTGAGDIVGIVLFVVSLVSIILTVYIARIVVLLVVLCNAKHVRTPDEKEESRQSVCEKEYNEEIRRSACRYQLSFCIHVILQMLTQILAYIAIAAKIRYDNRHFYRIGNTDESIHVSSYLWYMMFAGYM
jgi:hypothetical protein